MGWRRSPHSLSHSLTSVWIWCRAPMEICRTSGSSSSCIREVEMCLQADMQAVWATLPWEGERGRKRWVRSLIHFISSWETHIFFFFSLQKCKEHHFLYRLNVRRRKPLMNQCWNLSQSKWRYFKGTVHSNDRALVLFADVQTLVQHNKTLAPAN